MSLDAAPAAAPLDLDTIGEEQLLDTRIRDLPLSIEGTWLEERVGLLHAELQSKDLLFQPRCYLADEWLTPEGEPVIGIPFYLAHPRLIALEKKMMLEVEGESPEHCMKLLRHEAGHALTYAFGLNRKRSWQRVFGHPSQEYDDAYRFRPYSKSFVRHLDSYYAQNHPDEDFVETFAVWLTPGLDWRTRYRGWKALDKLEFVDRLMQSIAGQTPQKKSGRQHWRASRIRSTLRHYYQKRRHAEAENYPDFHDANLRRMFPASGQPAENQRAVAPLLQAQRRALLGSIAEWTGESRFMVNEVLKAVLQRSRALQLLSSESEAVTLLRLSTYLTTLLMNYRHTNRLRGKI
ncbi:MAG TPA: putative zinc-binding metallopeptidase [Nevskiaceae bacterium]|nr:putative zinc-binding metallopeptidase [Nevskiaceae bacterium]